MALHEINEESVDGIRPVGDSGTLAVGCDEPIPKAFFSFGLIGFYAGPNAVFIEAMLLEDIGLFAKVIDLPFSSNGRGVARIAQVTNVVKRSVRNPASQRGTS